MKPRVYIASKLTFASQALDWMESFRKEIEFICNWPSTVGKLSDTPENAPLFWAIDFADISQCDYLIVVPDQDGGPLRGALVEAGYALAKNKRVLLVGDCSEYGTWQYTTGVVKFLGLIDAIYAVVQGRV